MPGPRMQGQELRQKLVVAERKGVTEDNQGCTKFLLCRLSIPMRLVRGVKRERWISSFDVAPSLRPNTENSVFSMLQAALQFENMQDMRCLPRSRVQAQEM
mgnify:CR=1 FL=1